jgi:iron complex transport system substrate-binding protein
VRTTVALALAGLLAAGCAAAEEPGPQVDASRIVTLSGDLTELVYALGAGDNVVGVDVTTVEPEAALQLPIIGVGRFITAEGALSVDPTLVLGDTQSSPQTALDQIAGTGVAVELLEIPTNFDELYDKIETLGELLGRTSEARTLVEQLTDDVEAARADVSDDGLRVAFVYVRGPDVVLLFGQGMVTQPLIEAAGAIDAGAANGVVGTTAVSAEGLIAAAPDVIIVPEEGLSILGGVEQFLEIPGVAQTPAGEAGAILVYPEGDFLTLGPRVAESLQLLVDDLADLRQ